MFWKKKNSTTTEAAVQNEEKPKKKKKKFLLLIPLALVLILGIVVTQVGNRLNMFKGMSMETKVDEKVLKKNAEKASIDTILSAYGSITDEEAVYVSLPDSVTITSYEVANGDYVSAGDVLAHVDKTSTLLAITEIQNLLDKLDEEMEEAREDAIDDEITASAPGKVKAVFVEENSKVVDAMYEHNALILISLDGQMAVEVETSASISVGDAVELTDEDGNTYTGKVAERSTSTAVITVSDEKTTYGETVEAALEDGTLLGSGTLYVHSEQKITGYSGTVKAVKVEVDDEVKTGDTLLTLTDTTYLANYKALLEQRHVLEDQMRELFVIYQSGTIVAENDGLVANLDKSLIEESTSSKKTASAMSSTKTVTVSNMSTAKNCTVTASNMSTAKTGTVTATNMSTAKTGTVTVSNMSTAKAGTVTASNMSTAKTGSATVTNMACTTGGSGSMILAAADNSPVSTEEEVYDFAAQVIEVGSSSLNLKVSNNPISLKDYTNISGIKSSLDSTSGLEVPSSVGIYQYSGGSWKSIRLSALSAGQLLVCTFDAQGNLLWIVAGESAAVETTEAETSKEEEAGSEEESNEKETGSATETTSAESTDKETSAEETAPAETTPAETNPAESSAQETPAEESGSQPSGEMPGGNESQPSGEMPGGNESQPSGEMPDGNESQPSGEMPDGNGTYPSGDMPTDESGAAAGGQGSGTDLNGFPGGSFSGNGQSNGQGSGQPGSGSFDMSGMSGMTGMSGMSGMGGMSGYSGTSGMTGVTGSFGTTTETTEEAAAAQKAAEKYAVSSVDLCTVTPQNQVNIEITVDESDILSLSVGDEAEVTLDALEGQSFKAAITKIDPHGSNSGGSTKYTATVTMDRETDMLSGMNATVKFLKDTAENVLSIPTEALNESGNSVFVYTSYDEKEDVLGNPVEVKTGVSDGANVEITEGLNEGDTYYYRYADSISWSFTR